jgi:hypothetical protein
MWFTFHEDADVCYLLDINKDHKVTKVANIATNNFDHQLAYGTILYGSLCEVNEKQVFIIEDMYYFCGLLVKHFTFGEKLTYYKTLMTMKTKTQMSIKVALPYMCMVTGDNTLLESMPFYESMTAKTAYTTHHVQFRSSKTIAPYLNHVYKKRSVEKVDADEDTPFLFPRNDLDHYVQMNLKAAVFRVMADIQNDVYHLFAYDGYTNIAYIGSRDSSVYMNKLFRNIRENTNVDYGEESEDEDIFQNTSLDKYVDLKKEYKMHCVYNAKFKKWVPVHVVDTAGLRDTKSVDEVEKIGIERAWAQVADADVVVLLHDLSRANDTEYEARQAALIKQIMLQKSSHSPLLHVFNKTDLVSAVGESMMQQPAICISAKTGQGLQELRAYLLHSVGWQAEHQEGVFSARQRHVQALEQVQMHTGQALGVLETPCPALDLLAEELRCAQQQLSILTGEKSADDLLGEIFSRFCIGK